MSAADKPQPSDATRGILRGLADMLARPLDLEVSRLELLVPEAMIALRDGDLERYMRAVIDVSATMDAIATWLERSGEVDKAIEMIDPTYHAATHPMRIRLVVDRYKLSLGDRSTHDLVQEYAQHAVSCKRASPKDCPHHIALREALRARGVDTK